MDARPCDVEAAVSTFVSVRFGPAGRIQTFLLSAPVAPPLERGDQVVVSTDRGPARGRVERLPAQVLARRVPGSQPTPASAHRLTEGELTAQLEHEQREREARRYAIDRIRTRQLPMKLSRVEHALDGSRIVCYFTADSRVDFRELVRDLASRFRIRVEMRQIGVRDEARLLGGYGSCGRPLCCTTWLTSFQPVSIKMARQQDLALNPSRLSGLCGRLKCCLRYELPNSRGVARGGCGEDGGCKNPTRCGTGGCNGCGH
jgi:cell fate regulator YaaT (PSP1 superfamily)